MTGERRVEIDAGSIAIEAEAVTLSVWSKKEAGLSRACMDFVIASVAKQSRSGSKELDCFAAFAPRNDRD
jgi:hypothetical protein